MKRLFLIVLDSLGAGESPDAAEFGDVGSNTIKSISHSDNFSVPNLLSLGLGNIDSLGFLGNTASPTAAHARLRERSRGKDTTIGHWEMAGIISEKPLPTYPNGFPEKIISEFCALTGRGVLCNKPYSGTEVIRKYGEEHMRSGSLIVYTSADSVFQIAAHESLVPPEQLYEYCRIARKLLTNENAVGRVIARPFTGSAETGFTRTANRRDFSLEPYGKTILDLFYENGLKTISVGKIFDVFAGRSISESHPTHGNAEGMAMLTELAEKDFCGLAFANLVDFDMLYGHRNDVDGYAAALSEFDRWLPSFLSRLGKDDALFITADHGCDPATPSTDHSREYVPFLAYGKSIVPVNLGTRDTFADLASTAAGLFGIPSQFPGKSFAEELMGRMERKSND